MKRIYLLVCLALVFSCAQNKGNSDCLEQLLIDYPGYRYYAVIPRSLCKTCGSTYPRDLMEAYKSGKIGLVFNCNASDTMAIQYYLTGLDMQHVIIDTLSRYAVCDTMPESIYPAVVYMKNNTLSVEYYNKDNARAFEKLKKKAQRN